MSLWFKDLPNGWEEAPLKSRLARNDGGVWGDDPEGDDSDTVVLRSTEQRVDGSWNIEVPALRKLSKAEADGARLEVGDLLVTKSSGSELHIGKTSLVTQEVAALSACYSNFMQKLRVDARTDPRFVHYWMNNELCREQFAYLSNSTSGLANLNGTVLGTTKLAFPSLAEQQRIANFLDDKTARIDALIAEKERLQGALNELLSSEMEQAFTGTKVHGARRLTGNQFFPAIPAEWSGPALKHLLAIPISDGPHETPEFLPEGIPFVSAEAIKGGRVDFEKKRGYISEQLHKLYCLKVKPQRDDIFMVKSGNTTGAVGIVETDDEFSVWSPLAVLRSDQSKILPQFLYLALQTPYFQRSVQLYWSQGTQPNIGMAVLENLRVALPPLAQQVEIVVNVGGLRSRVVKLSAHVNEHIARLREYRSSLISAAVTGQIDCAGKETL